MVYKEKFVVAVKANGKILRERDDIVTLPFGTEYSLLLKNLDSVKVKVNVEIDGTKAIKDLVLNANQNVTVERYLIDNLDAGNRFKFIERTDSVENHRGIKAEDGIIRVEFARERVLQYTWTTPTYTNCQDWNTGFQGTLRSTSFLGNLQTTYNLSKCADDSVMMAGTSASLNDVGITVPGSISNQQFHTTYDFVTEPSKVVILRLRGKVGDVEATKPITVKYKPRCVTCNKLSDNSFAKFCSNCGTSLELV